jgi:serine protease AprX
MVKTKVLVVFTLLLMAIGSFAQNRYVVHFTDRINTPYSIDQPQQFLSAKAIVRRTKQGIAVIEEDLPVNPDYLIAIKNTGAEVFFKSKWFNAVLVQADDNAVQMIQNLSFVSKVEYVAPNIRLKPNSRISDTEKTFGTKGTEVLETAFQNNLLGVDILHDAGYEGEGITIAFMDAGFNGVNTALAFQHIFQGNKLLMKYNLVENDTNVYQYDVHGTEVFGTVAGLVQDQYYGIASKAEYMLFVTEDVQTEYRIEEYNFLFAAELADSAGADVINTSLGYNTFDDPSMDYTYQQMDGVTTIITQAAELAFSKGMVVVTSTGNSGNSSTWPYLTAPADGVNVLSVGATDQNNMRASFSSIGPTSDGRLKPELMAFGSSPALLNQNGDIISASGTSFSSPQIAGLVALLWQSQPDLTNKELFDFVISLGNRFNYPDNQYGYGIPSYSKFITKTDPSLEILIKVLPNPFSENIRLRGINSEMTFTVQIIDVMGKKLFNQEYSNSYRPELNISTSHLLSGTYILRIICPQKRDLIQRVVK